MKTFKVLTLSQIEDKFGLHVTLSDIGSYFKTQDTIVALSVAQKQIDLLEKSLKELSAFCSDFQMFAHAHLVYTKDRKYYTFQDMRKAAYTMRKEQGYEPEWGDESYFDEEFKGLSHLEEKVKLLTECVNGYARLRSNTGHRARLTLEKLKANGERGMTTNNEIEKSVKIVAEFDEGWAWSEKRQVFFITDRVAVPSKTGYESKPLWDRECGMKYLKDEYSSLDRLCKIWKKLGIDYIECYPRLIRGCKEVVKIGLNWAAAGKPENVGTGDTIQQAALLATAKAIESLRNERTENAGGFKNG